MPVPPLPLIALTATVDFPHAAVRETSKTVEIPVYGDHAGKNAGEPYVFYTYAKQREQQLGIDSPEVTPDDIVLRVYSTQGPGAYQIGRMIQFRQTANGSWTGTSWKYHVYYNGWKHREELSEILTSDLLPSSGWDKFEDMFTSVDFENIPTEWEVEGFLAWLQDEKPQLDSMTLTIEYATPVLYRLVVYKAPYQTKEHFDEAKRIDSFMQFVDGYFERHKE
jgi:hypothetical protein